MRWRKPVEQPIHRDCEAVGQIHLEIVLDRCVRHDIVDEPLHNPEFFGEAFAGNLHGDVTDARFAVSLYVADYILHGTMQWEPVIAAGRSGNIQS